MHQNHLIWIRLMYSRESSLPLDVLAPQFVARTVQNNPIFDKFSAAAVKTVIRCDVLMVLQAPATN